MSTSSRFRCKTAVVLLLAGALSFDCALADCPRGDVKCRVAEQKARQDAQAAKKDQQSTDASQTGGAGRWNPDEDKTSQPADEEEEEEDDDGR